MSTTRRIHVLYSVGTTTGLGDGQLLERFATREGEAAELAFAALVERHGPMVLRVCRRLLRDPHDAQDAFQATFLVLVRKAGSLRDRGSVGSWLYGVAARVAMDARASSSRRRIHERRYADQNGSGADGGDPDRHDLDAVLHEELGRLPERYRAPVVLCHLEGLSHEEAALRLGSPVGTIRSRLARGRERLRGRLIRRGLAPTAGAMTAALSGGASAAVPRAIVDFPFMAAARFAAGRAGQAGGVVSIRAVALSQGVLQAMFLTKLKLIAGACLVVGGVFASGAGVAAHGGKTRRGGDRWVSDRAQVVKSVSYDVYNVVRGRTPVLSILPPETGVRKGQLVCELDSSALRDSLMNQEITMQGAEAAYENARLTREVAEIAVSEYKEGIYVQELQTAKGEIALAETDRKRAEDRLEWSIRMLEKKYISVAQNIADKLSLQKSVFSHEQAQTKLKVLKDFTYDKTVKELESEVKKALSDELAKKATWIQEKAKAKVLEREIARCEIRAPADGDLVLGPGIEEGAAVRERQLLFRVLTGEQAGPPE